MDLTRLRVLLAAPMVSLSAVLLLCVLVVRSPEQPQGIWVPVMKKRAVPLGDCSFNGFTVHVWADGSVTGAEADLKLPDRLLASRVGDATGQVQDGTFYVIADPAVSYGRLVEVLSEIQHTAPKDRIALVPPEAQVRMLGDPSGSLTKDVFADRCMYEWVGSRPPKGVVPMPAPLPGGRISVKEALTGQRE